MKFTGVNLASSQRPRLVPPPGFSLTELLVVIAVLTILLGLMLPALAGTIETSRQLACASTHRTLAQGLVQYTSSNDEWIPGYATSGRSLWYQPSPRAIYWISRTPDAPVQVNDWVSPSIGATELPADRDARFYEILERFADPSMSERVPLWTGSDRGGRSLADWMDRNDKPLPPGIARLMPASFQVFGGGYNRSLITPWSSIKLQELLRSFRIPDAYRPQVTLVGTPSRKAAFADGFRYLSQLHSDFDASWSHQNWGSFSERSPCDIDSRAWGRRGGGGTGFNIPLAYRHRGRMNVAFFDGHSEALDVKQSRNPVYWAPSGSTLRPLIASEPDVASHGYNPTDPQRRTLE